MKDLISRYGECSRLDITGREKSRLMAKTFIEFTRENPDYFRTIGAVGPEIFNDTDNPIVKRILELQEQQFGMFRDALSEGIVDGTVRDDLDPLQMAVYLNVTSLAAVCLHPALQHVLAAGGIGFDRFVADYPDFIMGAVDKPVGRPASPPKSSPKRKTGITNGAST
jgi:hypothetical protein